MSLFTRGRETLFSIFKSFLLWLYEILITYFYILLSKEMRKRKYFATQNILLLLQFPVDISYSKLKFRTRNLHNSDRPNFYCAVRPKWQNFFLQNTEFFFRITFNANGILSYFCFAKWTTCMRHYHWSLGKIAKIMPTEPKLE